VIKNNNDNNNETDRKKNVYIYTKHSVFNYNTIMLYGFRVRKKIRYDRY